MYDVADDDLVYIGHAVSDDITGNKQEIYDILRHVHLTEDGVIPTAPYLESLEYLDDTIPEEREFGIRKNVKYFENGGFDELWLTGSTIQDSTGMQEEIKLAVENEIPFGVYNPVELADGVVAPYNGSLEDELMSVLAELGIVDAERYLIEP